MRKTTLIYLIICILILINCLYGQNDSTINKSNKYTYEYYIEGKKVAEEEFIKNNKTGTIKTIENGIVIDKDEFKDGQRQGKQISCYDNGKIKRIQEYEKDQYKGFLIEWHENGQIKTLGYDDSRDSQESSRLVNWDEEGNLVQGSLSTNERYKSTTWDKNGNKRGEFEKTNNGEKARTWYENGMLAHEEEGKDGQYIKSIYYYENGQKRHEWYLIEGIGKYIDIKYYENGQIKSHGERGRGTKQKEGTWIIWERDGSIKSIQTWKDGRRVNPPLLYYFPKELFYDETKRDIDIFWLEVYSEYLSALEEPVLYNSKTDKEIYRFTLKRAFHEPVSIRIEKEEDRIYLYAKMADLEGESVAVIEPGILIMSAKKEIKKEYWERLLSLLEKINYWKMEAKENDELPKKEEGVIEQVLIKADGSHWILEGLKKGQYHFVDRWSPDEKSEFRKCCEYLLALSDLKIKEIY